MTIFFIISALLLALALGLTFALRLVWKSDFYYTAEDMPPPKIYPEIVGWIRDMSSSGWLAISRDGTILWGIHIDDGIAFAGDIPPFKWVSSGVVFL